MTRRRARRFQKRSVTAVRGRSIQKPIPRNYEWHEVLSRKGEEWSGVCWCMRLSRPCAAIDKQERVLQCVDVALSLKQRCEKPILTCPKRIGHIEASTSNKGKVKSAGASAFIAFRESVNRSAIRPYDCILNFCDLPVSSPVFLVRRRRIPIASMGVFYETIPAREIEFIRKQKMVSTPGETLRRLVQRAMSLLGPHISRFYSPNCLDYG